MAKKKVDFIQIQPWIDCVNRCTFCSMREGYGDILRPTPLNSKRIRLKKSVEFVRESNVSKLGIYGGEFFQGQLRGCENEWLELIDALNRNQAIEIVYFTAILIQTPYFLDETIKQLKKPFYICTSYDEVGRFKTEQEKIAWFSRVNELHSHGIRISCTSIMTQDFIESTFQLPEWLHLNLNDPFLGQRWYLDVDKQNYHKHLLEQNTFFHLPKRKDAIAWFHNNMNVTRSYAFFKKFHSDTLYGFNKNNEMVVELSNRYEGSHWNNSMCGHPYSSLCYADSNRCMMCDAQAIIESEVNRH